MRYVPLLATLLMLSTPHVVFSQTVYNVVPVDLGGGYQIAGGTITVLGTEITAWNIPVTGDAPFTFSEANPDALLVEWGDGFNVSPEQISFSHTLEGFNGATFSASRFLQDGSLVGQRFLSWGELRLVEPFVHRDLVYVDLFFDGPFSVVVEHPLAVGEHVVATVVPEPISSLLLLSGVLGLMGARQKRRRR